MAEKRDSGQTRDACDFSDLVHRCDCLAPYNSVLVAVSGGADSVAVLNLIARWAETRDVRPTIEVATIDHDLRPESAQEARWVGELSASLGLRHHVRRWEGQKPSTGLQAAARKARYQLLLDIIADRELTGPSAIVAAHSQDDQAETVVMRLGRGSGLDGLAGMPSVRPMRGGIHARSVDLVRPLLDVPKTELVKFLTSIGQEWLEDPSNRSQDFERVRLRQAMPSLEKTGLTVPALSRVAARAQRARTALQSLTTNFVDDAVALNNGVFARWDTAVFFAQPCEIQVRVLQCLLTGFGGSAPRARLQQIETLHGSLSSTDTLTTTLGGCVISKSDDFITVYRELGRQPLPTLPLHLGEGAIWDNRFLVTCAQPSPKDGHQCRDVEVRPLDPALYPALRPNLAEALQVMPLAAAGTLPSFWAGDHLIAVPSLNVDQALLRDIDHIDSTGAEGAGADGHGVCTAICRALFVGLKEFQFGT